MTATARFKRLIVGAGLAGTNNADDTITVANSRTIANDPTWDAAGDLVQGTGADTAARLAIGAEGTRLFSNGTSASWALGAPVLLYDYLISGSDKASIDTGADTPQAGIAGTSAFSGAYRVLEIWVIARTDDAGATSGMDLTLNNVSTGNLYDRQTIAGANATAAAAQSAAQNAYALAGTGSGPGGSYPGEYEFTIPGYAATTFWKVGRQIDMRFDTSTAGNGLARLSLLGYRDTAAITRVKVAAQGAAKMKVGSRLLVYAR